MDISTSYNNTVTNTQTTNTTQQVNAQQTQATAQQAQSTQQAQVPTLPQDTQQASISTNAALSELLSSYGVKVTEENKRVLELLFEHSYPLDKESFTKLSRALLLAGNDEKLALYMLDAEIRLSTTNAAVIKDFAQGNVNLASRLTELAEMIDALPDSPLKRQLLELLDTAPRQIGVQTQNSTQPQSTPSVPIQSGAPLQDVTQPQTSTQPQGTAQTQNETLTTNQPQSGAQSQTVPQANANVGSETQSGNLTVSPSSATQPTHSTQTTQSAQPNTNLAQNTSPQPVPTELNTTQVSGSPTSATPPPQVANPQQSTSSPSAFATTQAPGADINPTNSDVTRSFTSASARDMVSRFFVDPKQNTLKEVEDVYNNLRVVLKEVSTVVEKHTQATNNQITNNASNNNPTSNSLAATINTASSGVIQQSAEQSAQLQRLSSSVNNLLNQTEFVAQLKHDMYLQIPIASENRSMNSDLFVFKDKRHKQKKGAGASTALIALDTLNLGRLEVYVQKNGKSVDLRFALDTPPTEKRVRAHIDKLENLLGEYGYSLGHYNFADIGERFSITSGTPESADGHVHDPSKEALSKDKIVLDLKV